MKNNKILKPAILIFLVSLIGCFSGKVLYDLINKPDGYLYLDKDTKSVYAQLKKNPDEIPNGSKLIFLFKI